MPQIVAIQEREYYLEVVRPAAPVPARLPRGLGGQRVRLSDDGSSIISGALGGLAPLAPVDRWRLDGLDARTLDRISPTELADLLSDVSPDISRAVWDFLRFGNPGYTLDVTRPSGRPAPGPAREALRRVIGTLEMLHADFNVLINKLFMSAFLRGALFAELVLDGAGRQVVDLAVIDPATLDFRQALDAERGQIWRWGQYQQGRWTRLDNRPTVVYVPIDPLPGRPEGRAPAHPALTTTVFSLALLQDVRRVVQQQGYPRLDLSISLERLTASMPADAAADPERFYAWVTELTQQVKDAYEVLEPDDAYIHTDVVQVNRPVGAVDASSLGAIDKLMSILERQAVRALKTMPLLFAVPEGMSEASANRQWEAHVAGIKAMQHSVERVLERLLTLALEAQGVQGVVSLRFAELRAAELLRDAQVEALRTANASAQYAAGWISQDEAARRGAGVEQADVPEPRSVPAATADIGSTTGADPGANR